MAAKTEWIHSFAITETERHKKGFTVYKITSIIIPRNVPEALSCITVWKRFREVQQLYKDMQRKAKECKVKITSMPELKSSYFKRFKPEVIEERKNFILAFLNWIGDQPVLFRSEAFVEFFNTECTEDLNATSLDDDSAAAVPDSVPTDALEIIASRLGSGGEDPDVSRLLDQITEEAMLDQRLEDAQNQAIEDRLKRLQQDTFVDYLYEAALKFTEAVEAESIGKYEKAFDSYKAGIDILLGGGKSDNNPERKRIVKEKVAKYLARAEDIYENFIANGDPSDQFEIIEPDIRPCERPLNYLSRFKVIKLFDGIQQVQDVTDKKVYMLKIFPKPPAVSATRMLYLPQQISNFMVPLVAYCQSSDSTFLILKLVGGGKLWSYIQNYTQPEPTESLKSLFIEPNIKSAKIKSPKTKSKVPVAMLAEEIRNPSVDMEVPDLLECSQKLLNSVNSTLNKSKVDDSVSDDDLDDGSIEEILKDIIHDDLPLDEENVVQAILHEAQEELNEELEEIGCKPEHLPSLAIIAMKSKPKLLPETTVIKYCAELVISVNDLHTHDIVCGDLNLDNVLLGPKGQLMLTYFYKNDMRLNAPSEKAMDEGYVAPERPLKEKSDWWSVGIIMFELLTERRFYACHPGSVEQFSELQYPEEIDVSEEAKDLLEHMVDTNPTTRFDISQITSHAFFTSIDWNAMKVRESQVQS